MKALSVRTRLPILTWKEPKRFTDKYRPSKIFYGWVQFRIFLYLAAGVMGCWGLGKLNPKRPDEALSLIAGLSLSLFLGFFVAYGLPLLGRLAPSIVYLYPNYLAVSRGLSFLYFRFSMVSGYKLERESEGWILKFSDFDQHQSSVGIPSDEIKMKVEAALSDSSVSKHSLSGVVIANRKEAFIKFQEKLKAYITAARRIDFYTLPCFFGFLIAFGILALTIEHYFSKNSPIYIIEIVILFAGILGYGLIESYFKRRSARRFGLSCPNCGKVSIGADYLRILARTHTCPYCGKPFYQIAD